MSKKRGMSLEDKRSVILDIYRQRKEPFNLKEIESLGSKMNVVQQSIKDVNQSLVDDFLVQTDKIGSANFYWCFPAKEYFDKIRLKDQLKVQLQETKQNMSDLQLKIAQHKEGSCRSDRPILLAQLAQLREQKKEFMNYLEKNKFQDPEAMKTLEKSTEAVVESVNRWTDNLWTVKKYLTKKRGMSSKEVDRLLKIDSNFDYVSSSLPTKRPKKG